MSAHAVETTDKLYIMIDLLDDGSIKVREMATLKGSYNGRLRNIEYKNLSLPHFTGRKEDFKGSDIYNGSGIRDLKIYGVNYGQGLDFSDLNNLSYPFKEVVNASNGTYGVYTKKTYSNGIDLKVYQPSNRNQAFYIEYIVNDVVVKHDDILEFAWNILGDSYQENIKDLKVRVRLPKEDSAMRVWAHGPLNGEITRLNDKEVELSYDFLGAYNKVDIRMTFSLPVLSNVTKASNVVAFPHILEIEEEKAEIANQERDKIRFQNNLVNISTIVWVVILGVVVIYVYIKYDKEHKVVLPSPYYRDLPNTYGPEVLEYLLKKNVSTLGFSSSVLNLIDENVIKLEEISGNKKDYSLIKQEKNLEKLTKQEIEVIDLLFNTIGNGSEVTLNEVKKYGKKASSAEKFMESFHHWENLAKKAGKKEGFYQNLARVKVFPILFSCLGFLLFFFHLVLETESIWMFIVLPITFGTIIYFSLFKKRSESGAMEYAKWQAFKKFLLDFGRMDEKELPEIVLWNKYLVYATVLGCAKEVEKQMKIKMQAIGVENQDVDIYRSMWMNHVLRSSLNHQINQTINQAISSSRASIAASHQSSGSGFGGGVSSGGGSFGGGGGGGRF